MTIDEKIKNLENALGKIRVMAEGDVTDQLTYAECDAIERALTFVVGVYHGYHDFFGERPS